MGPQRYQQARHPGKGRQNRPSLLVQVYALHPKPAMVPSLLQAPESWPQLNSSLLIASHSKQVCLTCRSFRHHAGVNCIPLLTYQLQQGLLAQGEDLTRRSPGWNDDQSRQRGWAPEGR